MSRIILWLCLAGAMLNAVPAYSEDQYCEKYSDPAMMKICNDVKSQGWAVGNQDAAALKAALPTQEHIGADFIPEISETPCSDVSTTKISGKDLESLLRHLSQIGLTESNNEVSLKYLAVLGPFSAPSEIPIPYTLTISKTVFCGNINLSNSKFNEDLNLTTNLVLADKEKSSEGLIIMQNTHVAGNLKLQYSRFGGLIARGIEVGRTLSVTEAAFGHMSFANGKMQDLALARSRQSLEIYKRVRSWINETYGDELSGEMIEGYENVFFANNIEFWEAEIEKELYGDELLLDGAISAWGLNVGHLRFHLATLPAADFRELTAKKVELKATALGKASNRDCSFDYAYRFKTDFVSFAGGEISESFEITKFDAENMQQPSSATGWLCLNDMRVMKTVDISGLKAEFIDLSETRADMKLAMASDSTTDGDTTFSAKRLDLTGFTTPRLTVSNLTRFPSNTRLSAVSFGSLEFYEPSDRTLGLVHKITSLVDGIESNEQKIVALFVFAEVLHRNGLTTEAEALDFERASIQTDALGWTARRVFREIAERLGGYGLMSSRMLRVAVIAVVFGAIVARMSLEGRYFLFRQIVPRLRQIPAAQRRNKTRQICGLRVIAWIWVDAAVLSFDRLIPLVSISDAHMNLRFRHQPWVRAYFTIHAMLGLFLATTAITVIGQKIGFRTH